MLLFATASYHVVPMSCGRIDPSRDVKDKAGSSSGGKDGSLATMPGKARPSQASVGMSSEGSLATPPTSTFNFRFSSQAVAKGLQQLNCSVLLIVRLVRVRWSAGGAAGTGFIHVVEIGASKV
jgi:hypothetical protein